MKLLVFLGMPLFIEAIFLEETINRISLMTTLTIDALEAMQVRFALKP